VARLVFPIIYALLVTACTDAPPTPTPLDVKKKRENFEQNCISQPIIDAIRTKVFDTAITKVESKTGIRNLNDLRAALIGRIEAPLLQGHDPSVDRTTCSGKLVFGLPPTVVKIFDGATSLTADINYAVQPAADKSGPVVEVTGIDDLISTLSATVQKKIPAPPPPLPKMADYPSTYDYYPQPKPISAVPDLGPDPFLDQPVNLNVPSPENPPE
jgi:hypothetical protein